MIDDNGQMGSVPSPASPPGPRATSAPRVPRASTGPLTLDLLNDTGAGANALANLDGVNNSNNTAFGASSLNPKLGRIEQHRHQSSALLNNLVGTDNTAVGQEALYNSTGSFNIGNRKRGGFGLANGGNGNIDNFQRVPSDGTTDGSVDPTSGPTHTHRRTGGPHGRPSSRASTGPRPSLPPGPSARRRRPSGNLAPLKLSSLTTGATGDTGPTGATGQNGHERHGGRHRRIRRHRRGQPIARPARRLDQFPEHRLRGSQPLRTYGRRVQHRHRVCGAPRRRGRHRQHGGRRQRALPGNRRQQHRTRRRRRIRRDDGKQQHRDLRPAVPRMAPQTGGPTTGPAMASEREGTQTQTFIVGIYGAHDPGKPGHERSGRCRRRRET